MNRNKSCGHDLDTFVCVATLLLTLICAPALAQCTRLGEFRDGDLYQQYKVSFEKYQVFDDVLADIRALKTELESSQWMSSEAAFAATGVIGALGVSAKAIVDGLALAAGPAGRAIDFTACSAHEFVKFSKEISLGTDGMVQCVMAANAAPLLSLAVRIKSRIEDIATLAGNLEAQESIRTELPRQIERLERQIAQLVQARHTHHEILVGAERIKRFIDNQCGGHVKRENGHESGFLAELDAIRDEAARGLSGTTSAVDARLDAPELDQAMASLESLKQRWVAQGASAVAFDEVMQDLNLSMRSMEQAVATSETHSSNNYSKAEKCRLLDLQIQQYRDNIAFSRQYADVSPEHAEYVRAMQIGERENMRYKERLGC